MAIASHRISPEAAEAEGTLRLLAQVFAFQTASAATPADPQFPDVDARYRTLVEQLLESSEREQRRIGQDLHDGLGQHLTGIAFMSKALEQKLLARSLPEEAADAVGIARLVNQAIAMTRELSHGLLPVQLEAHGLMSALHHLADEVREVFHVSCRFECDEPILVDDLSVATHLYRIAQEAVHNAIKHGRAQEIVIAISPSVSAPARACLTVSDDGVGCAAAKGDGEGMGLQIMRHRAEMIGGAFCIERSPDGRTIVSCAFSTER
jgi:signal transduction histidine kinase